ncbi:MAG: hypothetical protein HF962_09485 [Sulfurovum sp.]|nr:hypothetical protein [Sulfurovum sp.]
MKQPIIAILVSKKYQETPYEDDLLLKYRLESFGYSVDIVDWNSDRYHFHQAIICIVRSCWNYHIYKYDYLKKLLLVSRQSMLINTHAIIEKYFSKQYLLDTNKLGINTIPTRLAKNTAEVLSAIKHLKSDQIILKPDISASGNNTYKIDSCNKQKIIEKSKVILSSGKVIVQDYIDTVITHGELSTVVIAGKITFTMHKRPASHCFLVHEHHGGCYTPTKIDEKCTSFVYSVLGLFENIPTYTRIDYLISEDGNPILLELEVNEPNLYLSKSEETLNSLCQEIHNISNLRVQK